MKLHILTLLCPIFASAELFAGALVDKVNPFIDTHKSRWFFFNSASHPLGLVSLNPDTATSGILSAAGAPPAEHHPGRRGVIPC